MINEVERYLQIPAPEATYANTAGIFHAVFGIRLKEGCGICVDEARYRLMKWFKKKNMSESKYKFKKQYQNITVVYNINGNRTLITADNLTDFTAELLLADEKRKHLIDVNEVKVVKPIEKKIAEPTLSTSNEAPKDGSELKENVSVKESNTNESKPLTGKKRGRKPKASKIGVV